jgi:hypothetical protein
MTTASGTAKTCLAHEWASREHAWFRDKTARHIGYSTASPLATQGVPLGVDKVPRLQFFHTDFRASHPLLRDANGYVVDANTQV